MNTVTFIIFTAFLSAFVNISSSNHSELLNRPLIVFTHSLGLDTLIDDQSIITHELYTNGDQVFDVDALDIDGDNEHGSTSSWKLFWSDSQQSTIYGATLLKSSNSGDSMVAVPRLENVNPVAVVANGGAAIEGIAVDWMTHVLYFVESRFGIIGFIGLNSTSNNAIGTLITNIISPRAIVVDSNAGMIFWTAWDVDVDCSRTTPIIERSSTAGDKRTVAVKTSHYGDGFPNGLAIDYSLERIFWIDAKSSSVHSTDYNGHRHRQLFINYPSIQWPFGLSLYENSLFWVDAELKTINQMDVTNVSHVQVIHKTYRTLYGIVVLHPNRHPRMIDRNPCANNGGCSHICLLDLDSSYSGGHRYPKAICQCPHMMILSNEDHKTCQVVKGILLTFENRKDTHLMQLLDVENASTSAVFRETYFPIIVPNSDNVFGINMDLSTGKIYWADGQTNIVWRMNVADGKMSRLFDLGFGTLTGFACDLVTGRIFYSILGPHEGIFECKLSNYRCHRILLEIVRPTLRLFYQREHRQLYWIELDAENVIHVIRRSTQDTSNDGNFITIDDIFNYTSSLPTNLILDSDGTFYFTTNDDNMIPMLHSMQFDGVSSPIHQLIKIPDQVEGRVNAMNTRRNRFNHRLLTIGTTTGRVFTVDLNMMEWSTATQYKSISGSIVGLAYASIKSNSGDCKVNCLNGGFCENIDVALWGCTCLPGFFGNQCEKNTAKTSRLELTCSKRYCLNGGLCVEKMSSLRREDDLNSNQSRLGCQCPILWWGSRCQFNRQTSHNLASVTNASVTVVLNHHPAECNLHRYCLNGGICVDDTCSCPEGYFGSQCEMDHDNHSSLSIVFIILIVVIGVVIIVIVTIAVIILCKKQKWTATRVKMTLTTISHNSTSLSPSKTTEMRTKIQTQSIDNWCPPTQSSKRKPQNERMELLSDCEVIEDDFEQVFT